MNTQAMLAYDRIFVTGKEAREDLKKLCEERHVEPHWSFVPEEQVEAYLAICEEVYTKWHMTNDFKVGDKVYVDPGDTFVFKNYIRATVTEVSTDGWGYHLRAFQQDFPGIYMFNQWDKDLLPRTGKANKPLLAE